LNERNNYMADEDFLNWELRLKIDLQAHGLRVSDGLAPRAGGAGPADGITVYINDITATVPTGGLYVERSPYSLKPEGGGLWGLMDNGRRVCALEVAPEPGYYRRATADGVPYWKIALRHGRDGVGSTVVQGCVYDDKACMFCAIALSRERGATTAVKSPEDIAEVARVAEEEGYSHIVLTTGTTGLTDRGIPHLVRCAAAVKSKTTMKVHVQFEPPQDLGLVDEIGSVSDSAAINVETMDSLVLGRVAPGKAMTSFARYREAWERAVEVFGRGQVTSFLLIGLGESVQSVLEGCLQMTTRGVLPMLMPLRPIRGTPMESWSPPAVAEMIELYETAAEMVRAAGLRASDCLAGCVRCGACSAFTDITG
jgi:radical SAM protein (TIGR04043 family)